jgi:diguanylate cyclase (GGDEF)-like protein
MAIDRTDLTSVLSEFARTLVTDFPIQHILDRLVERIADVLPGLSAGVTLIDSGLAPRYVAASTELAGTYERLQTTLGEGPCLEAYRSGSAVLVPDLAGDERFPLFAAAAVAAGLAAVFTFPLRHGDGRMGALDLYRATAGPLRPDEVAAAQTLADVAAAYLLNAQAREEARRVADHYQHTSLHDPLTGLPNRVLLQERLEHASARAQRSQMRAAVLFLDLDRLKLVNDTHGHEVGDRLLVAVAGRLSELVRPGDTLARLSGDEFVFLCEDVADLPAAEGLAARIDAAFVSPFRIGDLLLDVTASVGMAFTAAPDELPRHLLGRADVAMYEAKRRGGGRHVTVGAHDGDRGDDLASLGVDLRVALAGDQLEVAYQPVVRLADGRLRGVEALLRWDRGGRGPVPTEVAVDVAERNGLIDRIGLWVLERACTDLVRWARRHPALELELAVNVSTAQLLGPGFAGGVAQVLADTGMAASRLVLEVTESVVMHDSERAVAVMHDLAALGVRTALDDFGTGFSSLSYLRLLPVSSVKIDRAFVDDVGSPTGLAIVRAVTELAHVLGMTVTAEGVETTAQRDALVLLGCDSGQGFLYAAPMSATALGAALDAAGGQPVLLPAPLAATPAA